MTTLSPPPAPTQRTTCRPSNGAPDSDARCLARLSSAVRWASKAWSAVWALAVSALMERAKEVLRAQQVNNVSYLVGDGTIGWREYGPYDAILVGAGSPTVPQPLIDQLAVGGRLLCPIGNRDKQEVVLVTRDVSGIRTVVVTDARFVPLVGTHGWVDGTPA